MENKPINEDFSKPGSLALAVAQQNDDFVFKKPLPVNSSKKVFKAEVLVEETYLDEIGKIIQRDFFPDLEKLKAQNEYLTAIENNDIDKLREIYCKYGIGRRLSTDVCSSPATFETPVMKKIESTEDPNQLKNVIDVDNGLIPAKLKKKSLDQFLHNYTSEDNQSFEEIIIENEIKQRAKQPWLYKNENEIQGGNLAICSAQEQLMIKDKPRNIDTWTYKNKNYIMYVPDGVDLTKEEKLSMLKKKKEINHEGTRFNERPFNDEHNKDTLQSLAQSQARALDGKIGIDGKEMSLNDGTNVDGYGFVKTPSPMPGVNESPLMTWGQIEGTPFRLDGSDTPIRPGLPGPVFKIAEPPVRERLAHSLAEKVSEKNRDTKKKALEKAKQHLASASPMSARLFDSFDTTSPASHRLSSGCLRNRTNTDSPLRLSYTPKTHLGSPKLPSRTKNTPSRSPMRSPSLTPTRSYSGLTDNLLNLNIPKRPKASDFFS